HRIYLSRDVAPCRITGLHNRPRRTNKRTGRGQPASSACSERRPELCCVRDATALLWGRPGTDALHAGETRALSSAGPPFRVRRVVSARGVLVRLLAHYRRRPTPLSNWCCQLRRAE